MGEDLSNACFVADLFPSMRPREIMTDLPAAVANQVLSASWRKHGYAVKRKFRIFAPRDLM